MSYPSKEKACSALSSKLGYVKGEIVGTTNTCTLYSKLADGSLFGGRVETLVPYWNNCPSATEKSLKVPVNSGSYVCVEQCQYKLTGCVDIDSEPGMTCGAISTGKVCTGSTNSSGGTSTAPGTGDPGSNGSNDGSSTATNSATSNSSSTNTSTSTSNTTTNTTTTNNTTNNTSNSTSTSTTTTSTTNVTNTTTNTTLDLSSLENTIANTSKQIIDAINKVGDKIKDGSDTGSDNGTDMTETNNKLDSIKTSIDESNSWAKDGKDDTLPTGEPVALPEKTLEKKSFTETIFGTSSQCPANKTLSMSFMHKSFSKTFDFTEWCYYLGLLGQMILIGAYLQGANIVTRS